MQEDFNLLVMEFLEWSIPTFSDATPISSLSKCETEINEVFRALSFPEDYSTEETATEYADCLMCLFDSAKRAFIEPEDIFIAFKKKIEINKNRSWTKNLNNTYSHVKAYH